MTNICYIFDTVTDDIIADSGVPMLNEARNGHSSCATSKAAFVYGGNCRTSDFLYNQLILGSLEMLPLRQMGSDGTFTSDSSWIRLDICQKQLMSYTEDLILPIEESNLVLLNEGWLADPDNN